MAFPENISPPVISTKRPSDDADDCKLDEFRKPKTVVRKYPPPKIRIGFEAIRDFPPGCGIIPDSLETKAERKPLKKLDNVDSNIGNLTAKVNSPTFDEDNKLNSIKPKELGFNKPSFGSKPSAKVKFWDPMEQLVHDHPPVCRIKQEKKPLKNANNLDSNLTKMMNSNEKDKLLDHHSSVNNQLKSFKQPKELGNYKASYGSKPAGKVKLWDPTKEDDVKTPKDTNTLESRRREKINEVMIFFDKVYSQLFQENGSKQQGQKMAHWRVPMEAAKIVKQKLKWMSPEKSLGQIRGVHPGDIFKFRTQLQLVGLHSQPHSGIDYTKINGKNLAISIVDSHRYSNESESGDVLMYCGEGGGGVQFGFLGSDNRHVAPEDQKLERGNLALMNSINEKSPVRVIKKLFGVGFGFGKKKSDVFVYDGLYIVNHCTQKRGSEGKMVFMFEMHKLHGQSQGQGQGQKKVNVNGVQGDVLYNHSTFQML